MNFFIFPLGNGNLCINNKNAVISMVDSYGMKHIKSYNNTIALIAKNIPIIRGLLYLIFGTYNFFKGLFISAKLSYVENKKGAINSLSESLNIKPSYIIYTILGLISVVLSVFLFGFLPAKMSFLMIGASFNYVLRNFLIALMKIALFYAILLSLKTIPAVSDLYRFNAAGNQAFGTNGRTSLKKFSIHKPLNFLNFVTLGFLISIFVITMSAIRINLFINPIINILILIGCFMITYEILYLLEKYNLNKICIVTSFLVTSQPTITQEETAMSAVYEILLLKTQKAREFMNTKELKDGKIAYSVVYTEVKNRLQRSGIEDPSEVEWLIATALNKNRAEIKLLKFIDAKDYKVILKASQRREKGEPLSNIFGFCEFYGLKINVNKFVLTPRPETEILVEETLKQEQNYKKCKILDLCTGSGAIAISIAKFSHANVDACDISKRALEIAKINAKENNVKVNFIESDMFSGLKKFTKYDIIVSNPPYIKTGDINLLEQEVKEYDPIISLDGGEDGLDFYINIAENAFSKLNKNGRIIVEIGKGQKKDVISIFSNKGYLAEKVIKDYNKLDRIIVFKRGK